MAEARRKKLSTWRVLAFSSLSMPLAGVGLPLGVYLAPLYADEVGLGLGLTGFLFMMLRFWDIFTDPVMGYLVDRIQSPLGRVRHWILLSVPLLGLATFFVYMPPRTGAGAWYFTGWMFLFYVGFTLLQTSRSAWVPAIATGYDDRSRFFLYSEIIGIIFMLVLVAVPAILAASGAEADRFEQVRAMGWLLLIALPVSAALSCFFVPDHPLKGARTGQSAYTFAATRGALKNPLLGRLLGIEVLMGTGISVIASNYLFVAKAAFGISDAAASLILFLYFVISVAAMPLWLALARRTQKHTAFAIVMAYAAIMQLSYLLAALIGGFWPMLIAASLAGIGFGAPLVITRSMTADIVEHEFVGAGHNRAGLYYALLTVSYKFGASLALGAGYFIVGGIVGFNPSDTNSAAEVWGLVGVFAVLPACLFLAAAYGAWSYPFSREDQQALAQASA